jgi:hypothetical protein
MRNIYQIFGYLILFSSCNDNNSIQNSSDTIYIDNVMFINEACCSKLVSISSQSINSPCDNLQSNVLFDPTNFSDFELFQNIQSEEEITIKFQLIDNCETPCTIICNRSSGIPIKVLDVYY